MKRMGLSLICVVALIMAMAVPMAAQTAENETLWSHIAGDVDRSWTVDSSDVRAIYCVASGEYSNTLSVAADVNSDGDVDMSDAYTAMRTALEQTSTALIKPSATEREIAPEGDTIDFSLGNTRGQYAGDTRKVGDVWVVQSYDELKASFKHSNAKEDYTVEYDEAFFEDKALIVWASQIMEAGLVGDVPVERLVKNGNELCMVRKVTIFLSMKVYHFERHLIEIDKEDLAGIDTVTFYTEHEYRE